MIKRMLGAVGALVVATAPLAAQDSATVVVEPFTTEEEARYMELGRKANGYFLEGKADSLLAMADSATGDRLGGVAGIRGMMDQIGERAGVPLTVLVEKMTRRQGLAQFWFEAEFSNFTTEPVVLRWLFDEAGMLVGAGVNPKSRTPPVDGAR